MIVHLADVGALDAWAREIPPGARKLAATFWPGPLTLILKRADGVLDAVTGGQDTVGIRIPSHPVAKELLAAFGGRDRGALREQVRPGEPDDRDARLQRLRARGAAGTRRRRLRGRHRVDDRRFLGRASAAAAPGGRAGGAIEEALGAALAPADAAAPRAPGSLELHYAPRAQLKLVRRVEMLETLSSHKGRRIGALALEVSVPRLNQALQRVVPVVAAQYAHELYGALRALDAQNVDVILVEAPPKSPAWQAINDRLARAARHAAEGETT